MIILYAGVAGGIYYYLRKTRTFRNSAELYDYLINNRVFSTKHFYQTFSNISQDPKVDLRDLLLNDIIMTFLEKQNNDTIEGTFYKLKEFSFLASEHENQAKRQFLLNRILHGGYMDSISTTKSYWVALFILMGFFTFAFFIYSFFILDKIEITSIFFFTVVFFQTTTATRKIFKSRRNYFYRFSHPRTVLVTEKQDLVYNHEKRMPFSSKIAKNSIKSVHVSFNLYQQITNPFKRYPRGNVEIKTTGNKSVFFQGVLFPEQLKESLVTEDSSSFYESTQKKNLLRILYQHNVDISSLDSRKSKQVIVGIFTVIVTVMISIVHFLIEPNAYEPYGMCSLFVFVNIFWLMSWVLFMRNSLYPYKDIANSLLGGTAVAFLGYLFLFLDQPDVMTLERISMSMVIAVTGFFLILHFVSPEWTTPGRSLGLVLAFLALLVFVSFTNILYFMDWSLNLVLSLGYASVFLLSIFPE
ncbi:MAG: hypothetical protein ACXAEU_06105 [Candidatus Hodarchaeales archaeon]